MNVYVVLGLVLLISGGLIAVGMVNIPLSVVGEEVKPLTWVLVPWQGAYKIVNVTRDIGVQGNTATFSYRLYYSSVGWVGGYGRVLACSKKFFIVAYDVSGRPIRWIPYDTILVSGTIDFHVENNTIVVDQAVFNVKFSNGTEVPRTLFNNLDYVLVSPDGVSYAVQVDDPGYAFAVGLALVNTSASYGDVVVSNVYVSPWWIKVFELVKGVPQLIREYGGEGIVYWNEQPYSVTPSPTKTIVVNTTAPITVTMVTTTTSTEAETTITATTTTTTTTQEIPEAGEEKEGDILMGGLVGLAGLGFLVLGLRRS